MTIPGMMALFGSGETSAVGRQVFEYLFQQRQPGMIAILETPAGYELNSALVAERVASFLRTRLQNYHPQVELIPARKKGTVFSPDRPEIVSPMQQAGLIYLGAGSPTYAARQLSDSLAWDILLARHSLGAQVVLASAAAIAVSRWALPVYEIYKVGEDPHWKNGLDFFSRFGLSLVFVPHWNNNEGGSELDTSRCFMGQERFTSLVAQLPEDTVIVGIDEHTSLIFDFEQRQCLVMGKDAIHVIIGGNETLCRDGESFSFELLGSYRLPEPGEGISAPVWEQAMTQKVPENETVPVPEAVKELVKLRQQARENRSFARADDLRLQILAMGWRVADSAEGPVLEQVTDG